MTVKIMALVGEGGIYMASKTAIDEPTFTITFSCFPFFKGYITVLPTGVLGRGLALRTDCVLVLVVAGIMYVNTPSLSWRLGRKL